MTGQGNQDREPAQPDQRPLSANIYVDGFNLFYGCLRKTDFCWLDIGALCQRLVPSNPIRRIRYFTSEISARPDAPDGPAHQRTYLRALKTIPGLTVHLGHFHSPIVRLPVADPSAWGGRRYVEVIKTQEKGSDVNLATFLLLDAFRKESDIAVVVSNDSDLEEPIRVLIEELGMQVGLVNPHKAKYRSRDLLKLGPLFFKQVRPSALRACQFPRVVHDDQGEIACPDEWWPA
jgi:NYN domain